MTDVTVIEPDETFHVGDYQPRAPQAANEAVAFLQVIERAASDPRVDIDKMERLLEMQERILVRNAKMAYSADLAVLQTKLPVIERNGKITITDKHNPNKVIQSTKYALWEDINEAIKPVLAEYGFALSFRTGMTSEGKITVTGILSHRSGHQEETTITLPHDSTGSKNAVQAVGSSASYGKRYTASALLNLTSRGEDDDGQAAGGDYIDDDQVANLRDLIESVQADKKRFLEHMGFASLETIPVSRYPEAVEALKLKERRK
jgi:hypothetical protein